MEFISLTKGTLSLDEVFVEVMTYAKQHPEDNYRLIIGTDSQIRGEVCFVTALIIHREGKGGRFFYTRHYEKHAHSLRQRIFYEASLSLNLASKITDKLAESDQELNIEIHLDVGNNGSTKTLVKEVVGMVIGSGYPCRIKPNSYGASSVADRYTK